MSQQLICENCGEPLREIQYQARSADEAQRTIYKCLNCPLDSSRLDFTSSPSAMSSVWTSPRPRRCSSVPQTLRVRYSTTSYTVRVPASGDCPLREDMKAIECTRVSVVGARGSAGTSYKLPHAAELLHSGPLSRGSRRCVIRYDVLSPGAWGTVEAMDEYIEGGEEVAAATYVVGYYSRARVLGNRNNYFLRLPRDDKCYLCCEIADLEDDYWAAISELHHKGYMPTAAFDILDASTIGQLSNLSPRAWDAPVPTAPSHIFTSKVDGQRMWMLIYGRMCYYVTRLGRRSITGWWLCDGSAGRRDLPLVLDVEFTMCGKAALIDVLVNIHGNVAPVSRDMRWVLESWAEVVSTVHGVPVYLRKYFSTVEDAKAYAKAMGNPCDGVVGVGVRSTEAIKIKDVRSLELELRDNELVTADGDAILKLNGTSAFSPGDIIEVRFSQGTRYSQITVHEIFKRSDKSTANSTRACADIISCASRGGNEPGDIQRRVASTWCRELTSRILETAWGTKRDGNVIVDLGTGDGQSIDMLKSHKSGSYLLVEPDKAKCEKLARRAGTRKIHTSPMSLIPAVQSLQRGSQQFCIACMSAFELVACEELMKHLKNRVRCVVATFSIQFCVSALDLCSIHGLPFVGCCYLYNGVRVGEYLVDASGVTMIKTDNNTASVKWGGDVTYEEPALTTRDFNGISRVFKASTLKRLPDPAVDPDANVICSKVYVVTSI